MNKNDEKKTGHYNSERKGFETKDGGLIRIAGDDKVRIDIYNGNEREKNNHTRDTINYDTNKGTGKIDFHNEDKTEKSSTDVKCFLTTACMRHMSQNFDNNCQELIVLRWFRDNFVSKEDIDHYYEIAPIIVDTINNFENCDNIYEYIYKNIICACIIAIKNGEYEIAYNIYKNSILALEERFARPLLYQKIVKSLKLGRGYHAKN